MNKSAKMSEGGANVDKYANVHNSDRAIAPHNERVTCVQSIPYQIKRRKLQ